ncbi:MAG: hypothetical protein JWL77_3090 [Chthonomonadaceae bacterium]|nr:hypothetical protein [Chthonomonadaceae bacterium]
MNKAVFPAPDISRVINALYAHAEAEMPQLPQAIVPLGELFGAYDLSCRELPDLSLAQVYAAQGETFTGQDEKLAGFLFATPLRGVIYINRSDPIPRRRFSTAHELGHYLLHFRPVFELAAQEGMEILDLVEAYPYVEDEEKGDNNQLGWVTPMASPLLPPLEQMEAEADRFAAELLMPELLVRALWERYNHLLRNDGLVRRMSSEMMVSRAAMRRRLHGMGVPV